MGIRVVKGLDQDIIHYDFHRAIKYPDRLVWGPTLIAEPYDTKGRYYQRVEAEEGEVAVMVYPCLLKLQEPAVWIIGDPHTVSKTLLEILREMKDPRVSRPLWKIREIIENTLFRAGDNYYGEEVDEESDRQLSEPDSTGQGKGQDDPSGGSE